MTGAAIGAIGGGSAHIGAPTGDIGIAIGLGGTPGMAMR
jgi:hypothetical protein